MGIVRRATRTSRLALLCGGPPVAARNALIRGVSRLGPGIVPRGFDGIADRRPPGWTYAAGAEQTAAPR